MGAEGRIKACRETSCATVSEAAFWQRLCFTSRPGHKAEFVGIQPVFWLSCHKRIGFKPTMLHVQAELKANFDKAHFLSLYPRALGGPSFLKVGHQQFRGTNPKRC